MANYWLVQDGNIANIPSKTFVVNNDEDIESIPMHFRLIPMTVCYVVNTQTVFMVDSEGTWVEQ